MKSIDIIHKQLMNMSTVLLELIKQGITNKLQTDTERQQKQKFLLQQQGHLMEWITGHDPQNINSSDLIMPKELTNLAKYSTRVAQALPDFLDQTVNRRIFKKRKVWIMLMVEEARE